MQGRPDLSVIVVTHQGRDLALRILRTGQAAPPDRRRVADDQQRVHRRPAGRDRTRAPRRRRCRNDPTSASGRPTTSAFASRARYMLLLDPDLEIVEGTLARLVARDRPQRPEVPGRPGVTDHHDALARAGHHRGPLVRGHGEPLALREVGAGAGREDPGGGERAHQSRDRHEDGAAARQQDPREHAASERDRTRSDHGPTGPFRDDSGNPLTLGPLPLRRRRGELAARSSLARPATMVPSAVCSIDSSRPAGAAG